MDISEMTTDELMTELNRRTQADVEDITINTEKVILVVGTTCIYEKEDIIEMFIKVEKPGDLPDMRGLHLRSRFNSGRCYRLFYFKTNIETFNTLSKNIDKDNHGTTKTILETKSIKIERI